MGSKYSVSKLKEVYKCDKEYLDRLINDILPEDVVEESGTGYVIDCLKSSFKAIRESNSYEEAIKRAIAFGNDTDTTAAVTGGIAGVLYGFEDIPKRWFEILRGKKEVYELINKIEFKKEKERDVNAVLGYMEQQAKVQMFSHIMSPVISKKD